jgi:hypothetical protein
MRFALALLAFAALALSACGTETNYCTGAGSDGSCEYFQAPDQCASPEWCGRVGGFAIHGSVPSGCKKIDAPIQCP